MNDTTENKSCCPGGTGNGCNCNYTLAFLALRGWLTLRALLTGIEKFASHRTVRVPLLDANGQPDAGGATIPVAEKFYAWANYSGVPVGMKDKFAHEPFLPKFMLVPFDYMLGPALIILGLMLLAGIGTRISLFLQAVLYIMLTAGMILIDSPDGIAYLGIHVAMIAFALVLVNHNKFALLKKW